MLLLDQPERLAGLRYYEIADLLHLEDVTEDAGSNRDSRGYIARFLRDCGISTPAPWCAAFVASCLLAAGVPRRELPAYPASTYSWAEWAFRSKRLRRDFRGQVQRGDLFVWNSNLKSGYVWPGGGQGHIGIVVGVSHDGRWLRTIEGNSNADGSRNGNALIRRGSRSGRPGEAALTPNTTENWRPVGHAMHRIQLPTEWFRRAGETE